MSDVSDHVSIGQVWRDCDKRMRGRMCRVIGFEGANLYERKAVLEHVNTGLRTKVRVIRMYPHSTGWELVR